MTTESSLLVLISGAGPTGLTAALELRRFGIPVRLIDAMDGPSPTSRAIGIQARTLEELELRGLSEEFIRLGKAAKGATVFGGGKQLFRADFTQIESRYNFLLFLPQSDTERILRDALAKEGTKVEFGMKMIAFAQDAEGVTATLEHMDRRLEEVSAKYLISAEGAHSIIRTSLDLPFKGTALDQYFALGDLHADGDLPDSDLYIFSSEKGFMGLFPMGGSHFRLIAGYPHGDLPEGKGPTLTELQAIYDERTHIPARLRQLAWSSWFHINSRMVEKLKVGRVFLGGDAAHIHSPAGAQGMNTGIQDMMNLGWKLALVMKGMAPDQLLDSYEQDRIPVMHSILSETERATELVASENKLVRSLFNHLAPWVGGLSFVEENAVARISQLSLNYRDSSLSADYGAAGNLRAGDRVPELILQVSTDHGRYEETRLFNLLNPSRFTLLLVNLPDSWPQEGQLMGTLELGRQMIVQVRVQPPVGEEKQKYHHHFGSLPSLVLVRPDAYVGFRGSERSISHLAEYCDRWLSPDARRQAA
jgi:2-polyprenyl-6-methoxyphenol hydroxylase-like FAD-dependent oxidoreductase